MRHITSPQCAFSQAPCVPAFPRSSACRFEKLSAAELTSRFPQWQVNDSTVALFQPGGGLVDAALGNSVHVQLAQSRGADIIEECAVLRLEPVGRDECLVSRCCVEHLSAVIRAYNLINSFTHKLNYISNPNSFVSTHQQVRYLRMHIRRCTHLKVCFGVVE